MRMSMTIMAFCLFPPYLTSPLQAPSVWMHFSPHLRRLSLTFSFSLLTSSRHGEIREHSLSDTITMEGLVEVKEQGEKNIAGKCGDRAIDRWNVRYRDDTESGGRLNRIWRERRMR